TCLHELHPALEAGALVLLADAVVQGEAGDALVSVSVAHAILEVVGQAACDGPQARRISVVPVLHVVGFGHAAGAAVAHRVAPHGVLDDLGRAAVDGVQAPALRHPDTLRMPDEDTGAATDDVGEDAALRTVQVLPGVLSEL